MLAGTALISFKGQLSSYESLNLGPQGQPTFYPTFLSSQSVLSYDLTSSNEYTINELKVESLAKDSKLSSLPTLPFSLNSEKLYTVSGIPPNSEQLVLVAPNYLKRIGLTLTLIEQEKETGINEENQNDLNLKVFEYDSSTMTFRSIPTKGDTPKALFHHSGCSQLNVDQFLIYGGQYTSSSLFNQNLYQFNTSTSSWSTFKPLPSWPRVTLSKSLCYDNKMALLGGHNSLGAKIELNHLKVFDLKTKLWDDVKLKGTKIPSDHYLVSLISDYGSGNKVLILTFDHFLSQLSGYVLNLKTYSIDTEFQIKLENTFKPDIDTNGIISKDHLFLSYNDELNRKSKLVVINLSSLKESKVGPKAHSNLHERQSFKLTRRDKESFSVSSDQKGSFKSATPEKESKSIIHQTAPSLGKIDSSQISPAYKGSFPSSIVTKEDTNKVHDSHQIEKDTNSNKYNSSDTKVKSEDNFFRNKLTSKPPTNLRKLEPIHKVKSAGKVNIISENQRIKGESIQPKSIITKYAPYLRKKEKEITQSKVAVAEFAPYFGKNEGVKLKKSEPNREDKTLDRSISEDELTAEIPAPKYLKFKSEDEEQELPSANNESAPKEPKREVELNKASSKISEVRDESLSVPRSKPSEKKSKNSKLDTKIADLSKKSKSNGNRIKEHDGSAKNSNVQDNFSNSKDPADSREIKFNKPSSKKGKNAESKLDGEMNSIEFDKGAKEKSDTSSSKRNSLLSDLKGFGKSVVKNLYDRISYKKPHSNVSSPTINLNSKVKSSKFKHHNAKVLNDTETNENNGKLKDLKSLRVEDMKDGKKKESVYSVHLDSHDKLIIGIITGVAGFLMIIIIIILLLWFRKKRNDYSQDDSFAIEDDHNSGQGGEMSQLLQNWRSRGGLNGGSSRLSWPTIAFKRESQETISPPNEVADDICSTIQPSVESMAGSTKIDLVFGNSSSRNPHSFQDQNSSEFRFGKNTRRESIYDRRMKKNSEVSQQLSGIDATKLPEMTGSSLNSSSTIEVETDNEEINHLRKDRNINERVGANEESKVKPSTPIKQGLISAPKANGVIANANIRPGYTFQNKQTPFNSVKDETYNRLDRIQQEVSASVTPKSDSNPKPSMNTSKKKYVFPKHNNPAILATSATSQLSLLTTANPNPNSSYSKMKPSPQLNMEKLKGGVTLDSGPKSSPIAVYPDANETSFNFNQFKGKAIPNLASKPKLNLQTSSPLVSQHNQNSEYKPYYESRQPMHIKTKSSERAQVSKSPLGFNNNRKSRSFREPRDLIDQLSSSLEGDLSSYSKNRRGIQNLNTLTPGDDSSPHKLYLPKTRKN